MSDGPLRLRGHHLVCLQFYRGEGYSDAYVENLTRIVERAATERVVIVDGADDVCAACPGLSAQGVCEDAGEELVGGLDGLALAVLGAEPGDALTLPEAREQLEADAFAVGRWRARACAGCSWEYVCEGGWDALLAAAQKAAREADKA
jgi:hypothetical protein